MILDNKGKMFEDRRKENKTVKEDRRKGNKNSEKDESKRK